MGHTYTSLLVHIVFSTKDRTPMLARDIRPDVEKYICGVARNPHADVLAINSVVDHVHLLICVPANVSVSELVGKLKANSSRFIHQSWREQSKFAWQEGFGAFSVSRSAVPEVVRYIADQEEHHRVRTFQEEYRDFLKRYEINFDETYLWT